MNPNELDPDRHLSELRDTLHREAELCDPIGLGAETVQRRGRRRRTRGRSAVAVGSAVCLAAAGMSVMHRDGGGSRVAFRTKPGSESAPTLDFRAVSGSVDGGSTHFTTADGLTYELSTAPGSAAADADPGQAIYSTRDGEHWTTAAQTKPWIEDLSEGGGVLYAVGTAPGAAGSDATYHLATSRDGGQAWSNADLPFTVTAPTATVALTESSSVQVARGTSTTAALLSENFSPSLDAIVAADFPGNSHLGTRQTADGFAIVDVSQCMNVKKQLATAHALAAPVVVQARAQCANPPVLGTIPWSQIGLSGPDDLVRDQMLVSTDGTHWTTASAPEGVVARDLVATGNGFLLLTDDAADGKASAGTAIYRSTDANHWSVLSTPAGLDVQAIDGDSIIGTDAAGAVQTSTDGGASWNTTTISAQLPAGAAPTIVSGVDAGPLGFAALVVADTNNVGQVGGHDYLVFSADGSDWSTTDLTTAGAPAGGSPDSVTVGADHVAVDYESSGTASDPVSKLTTLLGTPQR